MVSSGFYYLFQLRTKILWFYKKNKRKLRIIHEICIIYIKEMHWMIITMNWTSHSS